MTATAMIAGTKMIIGTLLVIQGKIKVKVKSIVEVKILKHWLITTKRVHRKYSGGLGLVDYNEPGIACSQGIYTRV